MLTKCCLCVSLRPATLILAALGTLWYLSNAYRLSVLPGNFGFAYSIMSAYYLGASFACFAGFLGVLKHKIKFVKVFAIFYWWQLVMSFSMSIVFSIVAFHFDKDICEQLIESPDIDMDMEECMEWYIKTASMMVVYLGISCIIDLHFCLAVWAYYKRLNVEQQYSELPDGESGYTVYYTPVPAYTVVSPPAYDSVPSAGDSKANNTTDTRQ